MANGAGTLVSGRYRLIEVVGQGGSGRVWRGRDEVLDRVVAVKEVLLPAGISDDERAKLTARTLREARSAARLNHHGVITIHDMTEHDGVPWIVMEYINGQSLAAVLAGGARLPWENVASIGAKIADALAHAHANGIVHRDLKPANVLLADDRVVVTDFGIARIADAAGKLTSTGMVMGTPSYMAPEQLEGRNVDAAADIWGLGATLYAAVEGKAPFDGPSLSSLITAILTKDPAPPTHAGPLTSTLAQLLTKAPEYRLTAGAAAQALRSIPAVAQVQDVPRQPWADIQPPPGPVPTLPFPRPTPPPFGPTPPPRPQPLKDTRVVVGLALTIAAGLACVIGTNESGDPHLSATLNYLTSAVPLAIGIAALAARKLRPALVPAAVGATSYFAATAVFHILAIPAFHALSQVNDARYLLLTLGTVLGSAASVVLMIALRRVLPWGPRAGRSGLVPVLLLGLATSAWLEWNADFDAKYYTLTANSDFETLVSQEYPVLLYSVVGLVATAVVAWFALGFQDARTGGWVLLGWTVATVVAFLAFLKGGWPFAGRSVAVNWLSAVEMLMVVGLAIAAIVRRPTTAS